MSIHAIDLVWKFSRAKGSNLLMLLAIADHCPEDGRDAWCPQKTLAKKSRLCERAVRIILEKLVADGELRMHINHDATIPDHAHFAPKYFYDIVCITDPDRFDDKPTTGKVYRSRGEKIAGATTGKDYRRKRQSLPGKTEKFSASLYKEGTVQGTVQGTGQSARADAAAADEEIDFSDLLADKPIVAADVPDLWNTLCAAAGLPASKGITASLKRHIDIRLREHPDRAWWTATFERIAASDFLKGGNDRGWRANLLWFMDSPTNLLKLDEGNYDNREVVARPTASQAAPRRGAAPMPTYDFDSPEAVARRERQDAARREQDQREAQASAAIDAMAPVVLDALMVAASDSVKDYRNTMTTEHYKRALRTAMVSLIVEGSRGRTVADAVAYFSAQHGGTAVA